MAVVTESVVPGGTSVEPAMVQGISINDLRKNLRELNEQMDASAPPPPRATASGSMRR